MGVLELVEIAIPGCYRDKVRRFNDWRSAIADMTGISVRYQWVDMPVELKSLGPSSAPTRLPFVVAQMAVQADKLTAAQRLGHWDVMPDDPLFILLTLTVPGATIRSVFAAPMAERLREMRDLMHAVDSCAVRGLSLVALPPRWFPRILGRSRLQRLGSPERSRLRSTG